MKRIIISIFIYLITFSNSFSAIQESNFGTIVQLLELPYPVHLKQEDNVNAYTNGKIITVLSGILQVDAANTNSIAYVLLHEYAHAFLGHISRLQNAEQIYTANIELCGNSWDCLKGHFLKYQKTIRDMEYEADAFAYREAIKRGYGKEDMCDMLKYFAELENWSDNDTQSDHPAAIKRYKKCINSLREFYQDREVSPLL